MADRYRNFADLAAHEVEDIDYAVRCLARHSPVTVIAPHGGDIEPRTSEVARTMAAERYNLCCFEGLQAGRPHGDLHITSRHFDEPLSAIKTHRLVSQGTERHEVAARATSKIKDRERRRSLDIAEEGRHVLRDVVVPGPVAK